MLFFKIVSDVVNMKLTRAMLMAANTQPQELYTVSITSFFVIDICFHSFKRIVVDQFSATFLKY